MDKGILSVSDLQKDFVQELVKWDKKGLKVGNRFMVEYWERPLQKKLVEHSVCRENKVLEVGYGLGMASENILSMSPSRYICLEAHPEIAKYAKPNLELIDKDYIVLNDFWENCIDEIKCEKFDSIIFDPYPYYLSSSFKGTCEETFDMVFWFIKRCKSLLGTFGKVAFIDFSCELDVYEPYLKLLNVNDFKFNVVDVCLHDVNDLYCNKNKSNIHILMEEI